MSLVRRRHVMLAAASLAVAAMPPARGPIRVAALAPRIGVVAPAARHDPGLPARLAAGVRLGLGGNGASVLVRTTGPNPGDALAPATELLARDGVHALVAVLPPDIPARLLALLETAGRPLIAVDGGANAESPAARHPLFFRDTWGHWQAAWALGAWAGRHLGRRAFILASWYESGHDAGAAFRDGLQSAGGRVVGTAVTHVDPAHPGLSQALAEGSAARPEILYAMYGGTQADDFLRAFTQARGALQGVPLLGTPAVAASRAAIGVLPGDGAVDFEVLGQEAGIWLREAVARAGTDGARLAAALRASAPSGPRGPLRLDPASQALEVPLGLAAPGHGLTSLGDTASIRVHAAPLRAARTSGWTNAYWGVAP